MCELVKCSTYMKVKLFRMTWNCFQVVNLLVQTNPALAARPNKENVLLLMPFFAENYVMAKAEAAVAGRERARSQSRGRSIFSRRKTSAASSSTSAAGSGPQLAL